MIENYYIVNRIHCDARRIDVVVKESFDDNMSDGELLEGIKAKYGRNEVGEPYPISKLSGEHEVKNNNSPYRIVSDRSDVLHYRKRTAKEIDMILKSLSLQHKLLVMFACAAPSRIVEVKGIYDSFLTFNGKVSVDDILFSASRSLNRCAMDGWPTDPDKRRLARVQRFFTNNDVLRLSNNQKEISLIVNSPNSDHAIFLELYYSYGKDEHGEDLLELYDHNETVLKDDTQMTVMPLPCYISNNLRFKVTDFLSRACPLAATEDLVFSFLALYQRKGMTEPDELINVMMDQFDCRQDGWPSDPVCRVRNRVTRYLMQFAAEDLKFVDEIIGECASGSPGVMSTTNIATVPFSGNIHEQLVMNRLFEKYGRKEDGTPLLNTLAIRNSVCEFLEQYLPDDKVEAAMEKAVRLEFYPDTLMATLRKEYANFTPYPNPLRERLRYIYKRAAPSKMNQIHYLMRVKREENIPSKVILRTVCQRLNVGSDGWPKDPVERRRRRLTLFFQNNDPSRLEQIDVLIKRDKRGDNELFHELVSQYGKNEIGEIVLPSQYGTELPREIGSTTRNDVTSYSYGKTRHTIADYANDYVSPPVIGPADHVVGQGPTNGRRQEADRWIYNNRDEFFFENQNDNSMELTSPMSSLSRIGNSSNTRIVGTVNNRSRMTAHQSSIDNASHFETFRHRYAWLNR